MITNIYGQPVYTEQDLFDLCMTQPNFDFNSNILVEKKISFDPALELHNIPTLIEELTDLPLTVPEFDKVLREHWMMPDEYKNLDIAKYVLDQCTHEEEMQRVGKELLIYQKRDLFPLLQYMKYLVDLMRENKIIWGVGRGSSVSSFVLFLIGIHRINSLHYDLNIEEFLK